MKAETGKKVSVGKKEDNVSSVNKAVVKETKKADEPVKEKTIPASDFEKK